MGQPRARSVSGIYRAAALRPVWHGTADGLVSYSNHLEAIMQWGNVLGLSTSPTVSNLTTIVGVTNQWIHQICRTQMARRNSKFGRPSAVITARRTRCSKRDTSSHSGLDKGGPVDLGAGVQRGRPKLNAARTTFVVDNGQIFARALHLHGGTGATTYDQIAKMKTLGFNAVHLYGSPLIRVIRRTAARAGLRAQSD